jgi:hypothetical protein
LGKRPTVRPAVPEPPERVQQSECGVAGRDVTELHRTEIDTLVHRGLLRADDRDDEGAVVDALSHYIEQALGSAS